MAVDFLLPEIGEGVVEGEVVEWLVQVGDTVVPDQPLVSVLTDKATVEIASSFSGVIATMNGEPEDVVLVGAVLLTYTSEGEAPAPAPVEPPKNVGQAVAPKIEETGRIVDFPLPEIGEGVMEGEIVEWHVSVGDKVVHDTPVVAVLTDKATVEITAPIDGVVVETVGQPEDMIAVGQVIMRLQSQGAAAPAAPIAPTTAAVPQPTKAAPAAAASTGSVNPEDNPSISAFGTPLATPAVRRLAAQKGLDLRTVLGTGPNHRITRADVDGALAAPAAAPQPVATAAKTAPSAAAKAAAPAPAGGETRERLRGLRKAIHASMTKSKSTIPHFTFVDEIEMDKLMAIRASLKDTAAQQGVKLTYLPFIAKAIVLGLKKFPILNASVDDESGEIVYKHYYNLGIATATQAGLTVPVLKNADQKSVLELAAEMVEITDRARNKKSTMDDITGGTFTITSLGRLGGLLATPIINHPEVGILGIHNLQERAVVRDGQIVIRNMMNISLSFDHRIVDGDVGASFALEVKSYLEEPGKLLLHMV